jgi:hypothetical protein
MRKHLNRVKKCPKKFESYKYTDDDIINLSLIKNDNINKILSTENNKKENITETVLKNNIKTFKTVDEILLHISFNKDKICMFCNSEFSRITDLKRHVKNSCKKVSLNLEYNNKSYKIDNEPDKMNNASYKNDDESDKIDNIINIENKNITNNNQSITNNITINVYNDCNIKNNSLVIPFEQKWDVSKINDAQKLILFLDDVKYSKTMEEILKNDKNINVIFDKESNSGLIYKNEEEQFINMNTNEIIDNTMEKLYNHLTDFYNEMKGKGYMLSELKYHKEIVDKKYETYDKDKNTKDIVKNIFIDIFDKTKDKVIEKFFNYDKNDVDIKDDNDIKNIKYDTIETI